MSWSVVTFFSGRGRRLLIRRSCCFCTKGPTANVVLCEWDSLPSFEDFLQSSIYASRSPVIPHKTEDTVPVSHLLLTSWDAVNHAHRYSTTRFSYEYNGTHKQLTSRRTVLLGAADTALSAIANKDIHHSTMQPRITGGTLIPSIAKISRSEVVSIFVCDLIVDALWKHRFKLELSLLHNATYHF